jgi:acyl-CoA thioester hydrolase|tara:strand:+ start:761 stop:1141 length:381 start_codon:yes stop_codon:yes gene_type:complete
MLEVNIYYEDTDCGGVVYYANYLRYFERARTEYIKSKGISLAEWQKKGIIFTVSRAEVKYVSPARYGETLLISTEIPEKRKASLTIHHVITDKKDGRTIVTGSVKLACVNSTGRPTRFPREFDEKI